MRLIFNNLIQPLKYKYGMKVSTLFQKACTYLQIPFSSTILQNSVYKNLVIIPKKTTLINTPTFTETLFGNSVNRKNYDETHNSNAYGYYEGTFKDLILSMN